MPNVLKRSSALVLALVSSVSLTALAQPALAQDNDKPEASTSLSEVVVTARKREESLQDVPVSVGAVDQKQLEKYNLVQVLDLTNKLPNFIMPTAVVNSVTDVSVRGINVSVRNAGFNPSVSFYVDGVYQGRPANFNQILLDVERVELLLGPQGTLFGNNTIAGVVNIVTQKPQATPGGFVRLGVGNYNMYEAEMSADMPINDHFFTRLSGIIQQRDGYQENLFTGKDQGNLNRGALRWQGMYQGERTTARVMLGYQAGDERPAVQEYIEQGASVFVANPPFDNGFNAAPDSFDLLQDPSTSEFSRFDATLDIRHELTPDLSLVSITGYKNTDANDFFDQDFAADPRLRSDVLNHETQYLLSQEFRLESDPSKRLSYVAGLYYLHDMVKLTRDYNYRPPFIILGALGNLGLGIDSYSELETDTYAAFGNVQYDILPNLELSAGLRYSGESMRTLYDQAEFFRVPNLPTNVVLPLGPTGGVLIANAPRYEDDRSDGLWSGTATLTYHFDDARMIYARYARGTKSGGFNLEPLPNPLPPDRSFDKETLDNWELGAKTQWWDNRFRLNLTGFFQQYHGLQRADLIPIEIAPGVFGATRVIRNAAEVEAKGVELTAELVPVDGLTLSAAYGYSSAKYVEYILLNGSDLSGTDLTGVPKWNAQLAADYVRPIGSSFVMSAGVSADFRGERLLGQTDAVAVGVAGYHVINAYLGFGPDSGRWELRAWANNLSDELYVTSRGALTDFYNADLVGYGLPRTFGLSLRFRFGS